MGRAGQYDKPVQAICSTTVACCIGDYCTAIASPAQTEPTAVDVLRSGCYSSPGGSDPRATNCYCRQKPIKAVVAGERGKWMEIYVTLF